MSPFVDAALAFVQLEAAPVTLQESVPVGACDPVPTTSAVNESCVFRVVGETGLLTTFKVGVEAPKLIEIGSEVTAE